MPRPRVHKCTTHLITFCPENKQVLEQERKKQGVKRGSINYSEVVNGIVEEWIMLKEKSKTDHP